MNSDAKTLPQSGNGVSRQTTESSGEEIRVSVADGLLPVLLLAAVSVASLSNFPPRGLLLAVVAQSALVSAGCLLAGGRPSLTYALSLLLACQYAVLLSCCPSVCVSASVSLSLPVVFLALPILASLVRPRLWAGLPGLPAVLCAFTLFFFLVLAPLILFRFRLLSLAGSGWASLVSMICLMAMFRGSMLSPLARKAIVLYCLAALVVASFRVVGLT